ncbi:hypothetical protein Rs2_21308 [Raphanus sativus]|nr:hypothetical protein Rs2_21308 [Raphanus sativus]
MDDAAAKLGVERWLIYDVVVSRKGKKLYSWKGLFRFFALYLNSRKWETIPYAAGVIVPLALTLLVRNAKKDKKRGVIIDVVGGDPCHTVRNHQFRDPVSSHWEDISTLPDLFEISCKNHSDRFCGYERRVVHCVTGLIQAQRHCGYYLFIFGRGSSLSLAQ